MLMVNTVKAAVMRRGARHTVSAKS